MRLYRLCYGNGQVSNTYETRKKAEQERAAQQAWGRAHQQPSYPIRLRFRDPDTGDWFTVREEREEKS